MSGAPGLMHPDEIPSSDEEDEERLTGKGLERREDAAFLRGLAQYTDDLRHPEMATLTFLRSPHGHARIRSIEPADAEAIDGVLGVYTWADIESSDSPGVLPISTGRLEHAIPGHPLLARKRVRYHGQSVAAVVATNGYLARDGAAAIAVDYEPLDAVVDQTEATEPGSPTVHDGIEDNVIARSSLGDEVAATRALDDADRTTQITLENNRLIPSALEPRVALAQFDAVRERFTVELASQSVHGHRRKLAQTLGIPEQSLRVVAPAVGGGFGHKGHHHPGEAMAAWAARELGRPVKWTATRSENYLEGAHGRDHHTTAEIGLDADGTIRAIKVETDANVGAYGLGGSAGMSARYGRLLSSEYDIPAIHCATRGILTHTAPIHSYRGAGRPEAVYVTERLVEAAARDLGMDPVELRRRNLIAPEQFPYETAVGASYDSGDYEPALDRALEFIQYDQLRTAGRTRDDGRLRGIGVACYTESTGGGSESGVVRVNKDGSVSVFAGTHSHGQGHETTYAQLVADALEIPYERIDVSEGDTEETPAGTGTFGSRSTVVAGNAIVESAQKVRRKAVNLAAHLLEVEPTKVTYTAETFTCEGPTADVSFEEVASLAYSWGVPEHLEPGLEATTFFSATGTAYSFGTHAAEVAIDPETGECELIRYVAVDDCGERVNPLIIDGQVHGGVAQGIGQARSEHTVYDADGILQTPYMLTYALPLAAHLPDIETAHTVTPSPRNPLGVKGIGEGGTIAAPPTIVNAVLDALVPCGINKIDMPVTDEAIWRAIEGQS